MLFDVDIDDDAVGRGSRLIGDFHRLEEAEVLDPAFRAIDQRAVIRVAFADIEFAPDDIVACPIIAPDIDALDIGADALVDDEERR